MEKSERIESVKRAAAGDRQAAENYERLGRPDDAAEARKSAERNEALLARIEGR